jgi:hypothetical protein
MRVRTFSSAIAGLFLGAGAQAADVSAPGARPAVDGPNGKFEVFGGLSRGTDVSGRGTDGLVGGAASMTVPLGQAFGLQVDMLAAARDGGFAGGAGGHLFWRNPDRALVGVYGALADNNKMDVRRSRFGLEGELYVGRFTLSGVAGVERTSVTDVLLANGNLAVFNDRTRFFNIADISYYALDNLRLSVGHRYIGGLHAAAAGLEYQFAVGQGLGYSAFLEARLGEDHYRAVWGGLRVYFGQKDKTLIRRHREDDPAVFLQEDLHAPRGLPQSIKVQAPPPPPPSPFRPAPMGPSAPPGPSTF